MVAISTIIFLSSVSAFNIKITEVFFEGAQEWIELTNFEIFPFIGTLSFSGVKSTIYNLSNVTISGNQSVIFGDNLTGIVDQSIAIKSWASLILPDNGVIDIRMSWSGSEVDRFAVDSGLVLPYIDGRTSFERVRYGGELKITPTTSERVSNVLSGIVANPGQIFTVTAPIVVIDLSWSNIPPALPTNTWNCISSALGILMISEVHIADGRFGNYIELMASQDINQTILLSWNGSTISVSVQLQSWDRMILTDVVWWLPNFSVLQTVSNISTLMTWSVVILWQTWQVLDSVIIGVQTSWKSLYRANYDGCLVTVSTALDPTPGFDERILNFLPSTPSCPSPAPISCSCNCPAAPACPLPVTGSSSSITTWMVITGSVFTGLQWTRFFSGFMFSGMLENLLNQLSVQCLSVTSSWMLTWKQYFPKLSKATTPTPKSPKVVVPKAPKPPKVTKPKIVKAPKTSSTWSSSWFLSEKISIIYGQIELVDIQADPDGSDRWRESVTLLLTSGTLQNLKGRTLRWNKTKRNLSGTLVGGVPLTLTGSFGFPNDGACIELRTPNDEVQDMICYEPEDEILEENTDTTGEVLDDQSLPHITITSLLPNPAGIDKGKEQIWLLYHGTDQIDLKQFKLMVGKRSIKISWILTGGEEQILKGNFGFPNTFNCVNLMKDTHLIDQFCYSKPWQGQLFEDQETGVHFAPDELLGLKDIKLKTSWNQWCLVVKNVVFECKSIKMTSSAESKLLNAYITNLDDFMRSEFPLVYYRTFMSDDSNLLASLKKQLKAWKTLRTNYDETIPLTEFDRIARVVHMMALKHFLYQIGYERIVWFNS